MILSTMSARQNQKQKGGPLKILCTENAIVLNQVIPLSSILSKLTVPRENPNELGKQLLKAAEEGNVEETKQLLARTPSFTTTGNGTSPLHLAAKNNHLEVCEILLRAGITMDARTKVDKTALHEAVLAGNAAIVETLLEFGADPNCKDMLGMTPLHWAAQLGHLELVRSLLQNGAAPFVANKFGLLPADVALQIGRQDILDLLNCGVQSDEVPSEPPSIAAATTATAMEQQDIFTSAHIPIQLSVMADMDCEDSDVPPSSAAAESVSSSPIPLETILLEGSDTSADPEVLNTSQSSFAEFSSSESVSPEFVMESSLPHMLQDPDSSYAEPFKLLQQYGIATIPTTEDNSILSTVMEAGRQVVLTDVGKEMLNSTRRGEERPPKTPPAMSRQNIITMTAEQFLKLTTPKGPIKAEEGSKKNVLRHINSKMINGRKRLLVPKSKVVPASSTNNLLGVNKRSPTTLPPTIGLDELVNELLECRRLIGEYEARLKVSDEELCRHRQHMQHCPNVVFMPSE